ncbi:30S ribosome-binding factor RbfA [Chelatococcus sp. GCM10030263]|uniref:30S ribosome-binding factor RbfA n=1 Tax=Chelatococcus sp. GCM10030263 TaxID=3273387 RepID=UPI003623F58C
MPKKRFDTGSGPSQRALRVGELVRHAMAEILTRGDLVDDVVTSHVITVPEVRMSPDLKLATIFVMPLGGKDEELVVEALQRHRRFVRGELARRLTLKFVPEVRFRLDESFDEAARIGRLLNSERVRADLAAARAEDRDDELSPRKTDDDETP